MFPGAIGNGRWSMADSAEHYKIARGEAMECVASLDVCSATVNVNDHGGDQVHVHVRVNDHDHDHDHVNVNVNDVDVTWIRHSP